MQPSGLRYTYCENSLVAQHHDGAVKVKVEVHFVDAGVFHDLAEFAAVVGLQQQEAAAAGAYEFASCRAAFC